MQSRESEELTLIELPDPVFLETIDEKMLHYVPDMNSFPDACFSPGEVYVSEHLVQCLNSCNLPLHFLFEQHLSCIGTLINGDALFDPNQYKPERHDGKSILTRRFVMLDELVDVWMVTSADRQRTKMFIL
ncbi:hypothetical protein [Armatimonas rosea]|uniref:Uncharacterized protein n=1 Tax=Armatimonas rosea TaxID=685828 RepID=A0A7W9SRJ1_ARMRO|nr:hypothetical protein [Armatimonas rosea]MBB6050743.1 hypothetical protein [Armatimonas rosea]